MPAAAPAATAAAIRRRPVACVVLAGNVVLTAIVVVANVVAGAVRSAAVAGVVFAAVWIVLTVLSFGPLTRGTATARDARLLRAWRNLGIVVAALSVMGAVVVVAAAAAAAIRFDAAVAFLVFVDAVRIAVVVFGVVVAQAALRDLRSAGYP